MIKTIGKKTLLSMTLVTLSFITSIGHTQNSNLVTKIYSSTSYLQITDPSLLKIYFQKFDTNKKGEAVLNKKMSFKVIPESVIVKHHVTTEEGVPSDSIEIIVNTKTGTTYSSGVLSINENGDYAADDDGVGSIELNPFTSSIAISPGVKLYDSNATDENEGFIDDSLVIELLAPKIPLNLYFESSLKKESCQ